MEHTSAFTSIIDSQLLPMRVGIVFLMGCCIFNGMLYSCRLLYQ